MYYIQETDKPSFLSKKLNLIKINNNKIILPIENDDKITLKKAQKLARKTNEIIKKTNSNKVVVSKQIKKRKDYLNQLYTYNLEIVDGKWLFETISFKVLEYILEKQNLNPNETIIAILINDLSDNMLENIKKIIHKYKKAKIVTNHIEKFKKIENQILEKEGIILNVSNNKRKSLSKAQVIINVDFTQELVNEYNVFDEAIIINLKTNVKINKKRFNGIIINDYEIMFEKIENIEFNNMEGLFSNKDLYEANIHKNQSFSNIESKLEKDNVRLEKLYSINSVM